jgi:hypothetical protein
VTGSPAYNNGIKAVLIIEVLLNATSMFNHGNVRIAPKVHGVLRCFVVTPDSVSA